VAGRSVRQGNQHLAPSGVTQQLPQSPCAAMLCRRAQWQRLSRLDAVQWQQAIDDEITFCLLFGAWESVNLPQGKPVLPSHIVLDRKRDGRYKARLVAGDHRQQQGVGYEEKFAPVCSYHYVRMLLAVAAREWLALRQFDIRTTFLNGELKEEVFIRAPPVGAEHFWLSATATMCTLQAEASSMCMKSVSGD
jgi:hypothetical protein